VNNLEEAMSDEEDKKDLPQGLQAMSEVRQNTDIIGDFARARNRFAIYVDEKGLTQMHFNYTDRRLFWGMLYEVILHDVKDFATGLSNRIKEAGEKKKQTVNWKDPNTPSA